ncbi:Diacylglycerol kinase [Datura stramonium]|uniref:Diacylglycerol kinase n=1 Tax=Datura stramonium TaxID=4076 RepID=A0ABS8UZZ7_DATST|nr:Diacylglycerol kinase [Datura stramonium]
MRTKAPKEGSCDLIAPLELPHSLHAFHRVSQADTLNKAARNYSSREYLDMLPVSVVLMLKQMNAYLDYCSSFKYPLDAGIHLIFDWLDSKVPLTAYLAKFCLRCIIFRKAITYFEEDFGITSA